MSETVSPEQKEKLKNKYQDRGVFDFRDQSAQVGSLRPVVSQLKAEAAHVRRTVPILSHWTVLTGSERTIPSGACRGRAGLKRQSFPSPLRIRVRGTMLSLRPGLFLRMTYQSFVLAEFPPFAFRYPQAGATP